MWDQLQEKSIQNLNDDIKIKDKLMILGVLGLAIKARPTNVQMKQVSKILKLNLKCMKQHSFKIARVNRTEREYSGIIVHRAIHLSQSGRPKRISRKLGNPTCIPLPWVFNRLTNAPKWDVSLFKVSLTTHAQVRVARSR